MEENKCSGRLLVVTSFVAMVMIATALSTPGWMTIRVKKDYAHIDVDVNIIVLPSSYREIPKPESIRVQEKNRVDWNAISLLQM